ncbi:MAG: hypothetical protein AAF478_02420 [Pseudomonadota bacterium]
MTFDEAVALQPAWVGYWLNWLFFGAFILPAVLLVWKQTRVAAILTVLASVVAAAGVLWMFGQLGYVKLLGLPHIIFWTPLLFYHLSLVKNPDVPIWPKRVLWVVMGTLLVSLVFDYVDTIRYILGEREPFAG